jgi:hypothetical protein
VSDASTTIEDVRSLRERLWDAGYRAVPVYTVDAGRRLRHAKPGKHPKGDGWQEGARANPPAAVTQLPTNDATNTGILCDGLRVIDIDVDDPAAAGRCAAIATERLGEGPIRWRANSPRRAIVLRAAEGEPPKRSISGTIGEIEVLGRGQQLVAFGDHESGSQLQWTTALETVCWDELPAVTEDQITEYLAACAALIGSVSPKRGNGLHEDHQFGDPENDARGDVWGFLDNAIDHDSLVAGAMTLQAAGMHDGAVLSLLRDRVTNLHDVDEKRRKRRFDELPQVVRSGRRKLDAAAPKAAAAGLPLVKDAGLDVGPIPPRQWLLGNTFCRTFLSELTGPGGSGKTALRYLQFLAVALERGELVGEHVFARARVLIVCLEDDENEVRRRIRAACLHHNIEQKDLTGWLFYWTPRGLKLVETGPHGSVEIGALGDELRAIIERLQIDLVSVDPFVKTHGVPENDNNALDLVVNLFLTICAERDCAADCVHHHRKGANQPGDPDSGRGASSLKDAGRLVFTLTPMSQDEAKLFDIGERERRSLVRLDSAKVNIMPPSDQARWFRLVGEPIENGTAEYPNGDEVQTVELWTPPSVWRQLTSSTINQILDRIDEGLPGEPQGRRYTAGASKDRAAWIVVQEFCPELTDEQARFVVKTWLKNEVLKSTQYDDPKERKPRQGLRVGHRPGDIWER